MEHKTRNLPRFELVHSSFELVITRQQLELGLPNLDQKFIVVLLKFLLILGLNDINV